MAEAKLLIIDDDETMLETTADILELNGFQVAQASTGASGLALAQKDHFDAALIDIRLPDAGGISILRKLREINPEMVCHIITGNASLETSIDALKQGANDYFVKPLLIEKLLHSLTASLEKQRLAQALRESERNLRINFERQAVSNLILKLSLQNLPLERLLQMSLERILGAESLSFRNQGAVLLEDKPQQQVVLAAQVGLGEMLEFECSLIEPQHCLCGEALGSQAGFHLPPFADPVPSLLTDPPSGEHCAVPILIADQPLGVLLVFLDPERGVEPLAQGFLQPIAETMAGVIHRRRIEESHRKLEEQLRHSQKMEAIGTLAGGIAHDFNNILTSIIGHTTIVREETAPENRIQEDLVQILQASERARDLVRRILSFGRKVESETKPVQLNEILAEVLALLRAALPPSIEILHETGGTEDTILAEPGKVHQVIMNLCTNGAHAMRQKGGTLKLRVDALAESELKPDLLQMLPPGPYIRLIVADTGHGMSTAVLSRIFEPYFTTKSLNEGTGLGLSVVYGIVQEMKGAVLVNSRVGEGTAFEVYFPALTRSASVNASGAGEGTIEGHEHVLYVDDEPELPLLAKRFLERHGYRITSCTEGREALLTFGSDPTGFDIVITDQNMPDMNGLELISHLRLLRPDLPIILTTGFSDRVNAANFREFGIREFLQKPFDPHDLARMIRRILVLCSSPETHESKG